MTAVTNIARERLVARLLSCAAPMMLCVAVAVPAASAQISVFDPTNYSQNILTAARTLQQINNQIRSLQNEATMLQGMTKNLERIDFPQLEALKQKLQQVEQLMIRAGSVDFRVDQLDAQLRTLFPDFDAKVGADARASAARARLDATMAEFRRTMQVQAQVVENVQGDAGTLAELAAASQGATGALQAQQATNQLLALTAKQQFQIQNLLAAQFRVEALEAARRAQAEAEARIAMRKFLGNGKAWTPR